MNNENLDTYQGARFYKCALQVNPYSYNQYRGEETQDEANYNQKILQQCQANEIEVVGLADHGRVEDSEELQNFLTTNGIAVFPGFEIASSEKIHMVCLYPENSSLATLNQNLGQLMGENSAKLDQEPTHPSSLSCEQIAGKVINTQGGFWYAAHMTGRNGLLKLDGSGGNYVQLWKKEELVIAGQIPGRIEDLQEVQEELKKYREIIENKNPDYRRDKPIAIINAKDIKDPDHLKHKSASCLIKMTDANFEAFKQAFLDPESRIRLNHDVPEQPYSIIESIQWRGAGFFREKSLTFSQNLNVVIGGRGAGKSTLIESIRYVLDAPTRGGDEKDSLRRTTLRDSQVILQARSKAQNGNIYSISRRYGEQPVVKSEQNEVSYLRPDEILPDIEILGQNEILEIEKDEKAKLDLTSRFLSNSEQFKQRIGEIKNKLKKNREQLLEATNEHERLDTEVAKEAKLKEQVEQFKKLGIEEKLKNVRLIEREKNIQKNIEEQLNTIDGWLENYREVFDLAFLQDENIKNLPSAEIIEEAVRIVVNLKNAIDMLVQKANEAVTSAKSEYHGVLLKWDEKRDSVRDDLNNAIAQLPEQAGKTGSQLGSEYTNIIAQLTKVERLKRTHENQGKILGELRSERDNLLEDYRNLAFSRYSAMDKSTKEVNKQLEGKVRIAIKQKGNLDNLKTFLLSLSGIGTTKIEWLEHARDNLDLIQWAKWIKESNSDAFLNAYKPLGMTLSVADKLCSLEPEQCLELEEIELMDTVEIELNTAHEDAEEHFVPLNMLSIGQKCTAILNLLLLSRDDPLIIDQPEDNLDNAFIANRIVQDLRKFKTNRQFLFATHNANIPVFGDAELIAVLESNRDAGSFEEGSIDKPAIREKAAEILEGGKAAFEMRKRKYGF
ncbi:MAG: ATPase [Gammaproteobacteria bacterium]|nr:ATPase [Gammaproteobacteria bacterium]MDE0283550.1 ATPase [Gammaproteobacteria bacterium]MDE0513342.1 ATPase [Gammaproteobacteria bacterium]